MLNKNNKNLKNDNETNQILRLNIGGQSYILLNESILRSDQSGFLAKFIQLNHSAKLKVSLILSF